MKKYLLLAIGIVLSLAIVFVFTIRDRRDEIISPLEKYSFENLRKREYPGGEIKLEKVLQEQNSYTSWLFSYFEPQRETRFLSEAKGSYFSDGKKITGMANLPKKKGKLPVVIMLRGYADEEIYFTGLGTRKAAGVFAENGFLTLAPDFLGFGGSAEQSSDILEARFYRPAEVLNLLSSVPSLKQADSQRVGLWAHSNGGQIALSVLEISRQSIPTTLWAPVTQGFPQSVLQYMGELDDQGKKVKAAIEEFLRLYDPELFSIDNYFSEIQSPLQIHQGTADEYIQSEWTDEFVATMKSLGKQVTYFKYPGNDHNLKQSWDLVVARDLQFFQKNLR